MAAPRAVRRRVRPSARARHRAGREGARRTRRSRPSRRRQRRRSAASRSRTAASSTPSRTTSTEAGAYWITDSRDPRAHLRGADAAGLRHLVPAPHRRSAARRAPRHARGARSSTAVARSPSMDLFASLTDAERAALARELTTSPYVAGERIFEASQPADSLYLLAARTRRDHPRARQGRTAPVKLATLEAPAYFGEMGLLLGQPRIATVARRRRRALLSAGQARIRRDPALAAGARRNARADPRRAAGRERREAAGARRRSAARSKRSGGRAT